MKRTTLLLVALLTMGFIAHAQENPFKKYGVKGEVLTLSKGKYKETFYNEEIMRVGTVLINTQTEKVIIFLEPDTTGQVYRAEVTSRFLTVDPLCEEYYSWSPYSYCKNNPILRIDPDGMDDYSVNEKGQIVLIKETDDKTDRLIALGKNNKIEYDDDGNMTNAAHDVKKGVLDNQKKSGKTTYMSVSGNDDAKGLFEFLGDNTTVEWGRLSYGKSSNYISTNNDEYDNGIQDIAYDKLFKTGKVGLIKSIDHSHPDALPPSGFGAVSGYVPKGEGDKAFATWLYKYYPNNAPNIKLRVYNPVTKDYTRFNNKRILPK